MPSLCPVTSIRSFNAWEPKREVVALRPAPSIMGRPVQEADVREYCDRCLPLERSATDKNGNCTVGNDAHRLAPEN
jgi:hypothetical protein